MPASYVHQCVASSACDALSLFSSPALRSAVLAGSEGPDPFFFSVIPTPGAPLVPRLGSILHTQKTDDFLLTRGRLRRQRADARVLLRLLRALRDGHHVSSLRLCPFSDRGRQLFLHPALHARAPAGDTSVSPSGARRGAARADGGLCAAALRREGRDRPGAVRCGRQGLSGRVDRRVPRAQEL